MGLFGGDSSSSTTNNADNSYEAQSAGQTATNLVLKGSDNNVMVTDGGAVRNSLDFAGNVNRQAIDFVSAASKQITASGKSMYEGALATVSDQNKLLADAYQQGQAGDQTQLKYAGFAVVGLAVAVAAVVAFRAK